MGIAAMTGAMQHDERNTFEQHLSREMSNNDSLHKKLDQLTVQCNMLQSDNHKLRSENDRAQHMNSLLKNKADAATDECKRAQNKLLQALREISPLRKDRQQQLNQECTQRQQQLAELQQRNTDFLQSQKTQFQVVKELDNVHTNRIQCEAVIGSLHTRGEQMQADQQLMINDLDRMFNIGSCTKQLSEGLRGRPL